MVVELRMQFCGECFQDSFETYESLYLMMYIIIDFQCKVDVQIIYSWVVTFLKEFFKLLNSDDKKYKRKSTVN